MKRVLPLLFLMGCGQPLISITPPSSEVWKDDITRRLGALEIQKADAQLVGKAIQDQQRQIDNLKTAKPTSPADSSAKDR